MYTRCKTSTDIPIQLQVPFLPWKPPVSVRCGFSANVFDQYAYITPPHGRKNRQCSSIPLPDFFEGRDGCTPHTYKMSCVFLILREIAERHFMKCFVAEKVESR